MMMESNSDILTKIVEATAPFQPNDFYFDERAALDAIEFFPLCLRHVKGEWGGKPIELADWQKIRVIGPLFGWKRKLDNTRRFRTVYVLIGRKNGKPSRYILSPMSPGLGPSIFVGGERI